MKEGRVSDATENGEYEKVKRRRIRGGKHGIRVRVREKGADKRRGVAGVEKGWKCAVCARKARHVNPSFFPLGGPCD